jgi:hypothetical protein
MYYSHMHELRDKFSDHRVDKKKITGVIGNMCRTADEEHPYVHGWQWQWQQGGPSMGYSQKKDVTWSAWLPDDERGVAGLPDRHASAQQGPTWQAVLAWPHGRQAATAGTHHRPGLE